MKILGLGGESVIIEASRDELANLVGYFSKYHTGKYEPKVGDIFKVSAMYQQLYQLSTKDAALSKMAKALKDLVELLEPLDPLVPAVVCYTKGEA